MKNHIRNFVCFSLLMAGSFTAHALTIVRTNDPSLAANLSTTEVAAASAAFDYAASQFEALYNNPVQINITLAAASGTGIFGESEWYVYKYDYPTIRNVLIADAISQGDTSVTNDLPLNDPTGSGNWWTTRARPGIGTDAD